MKQRYRRGILRGAAAALCLLVLLQMPSARAETDQSVYERVLAVFYAEEAEEEGPSLPEEVEILDGGASGTIGTLTLGQDMSEEIYYTFEESRRLSGIGSAGDRVMAAVYTLSDEGDPLIWYQEDQILGEAGLYQAKVPLQLLGSQWLMIAVEHDGAVCCRVYESCRKSAEIRSDLLDYELNLFEEFGVR